MMSDARAVSRAVRFSSGDQHVCFVKEIAIV
jgi:hypothetical protein